MGSGSFFSGYYELGSILFLVTPPILLILAFLHGRVRKSRERWGRRLDLLRWENARRTLDWSSIPKSKGFIPQEAADTVTIQDLDLVGEHSILHLVDSCISLRGYQILSNWFTQPETRVDRILHRQRQVSALLSLHGLRRRLKLAGLEVGLSENSSSEVELFGFFSKEIHSNQAKSRVALLFLIQVVHLLAFIYFFFLGGKPYFALVFILQYFFSRWVSGVFHHPFDRAVQIEQTLERLLPLWKVVETTPVREDSALYHLFQPFHLHQPSEVLRRVKRTVACLSVRGNPLVQLALNLFFPWDFYFSMRLEKIRNEVAQDIREWMQACGEIEALGSLADFAESLDVKTFPTFSGKSIRFRNLQHPLIAPDKRVGNDWELSEERVSVITGSNMSGKSTFLRTVGLNAILALSGGVVCADQYDAAPLLPLSLIRAEDSLEREMSLFYFEVRRLKKILEGSREGHILFLIDEIFRGTNNEERTIGAIAYLREISQNPSFGLLTTHDLKIAAEAEDLPYVKNEHFQETLENGKLKYAYKILPGPCRTTNALEIMKSEGLPT